MYYNIQYSGGIPVYLNSFRTLFVYIIINEWLGLNFDNKHDDNSTVLNCSFHSS